MRPNRALSLLLACVGCSLTRDAFRDSLHVMPVSNGLALAYFEFDVLSLNNYGGHYNFFPNAIARILDAYDATDLQLTMTHGMWRKTWGYYAPIAPAGARLYASFRCDRNCDDNWRRLIQSLSGLFCASFSLINSAHSYGATHSMTKEGVVRNDVNRSCERYGVLPSENVCTENLTPWKKLLPCKRDRGLLALLNPKQIYDSPYSSMAVYANRICLDKKCERVDYGLKQTMTFVFRNRKGAWNVDALFGNKVTVPCPLSSSSTVVLKIKNVTFRNNDEQTSIELNGTRYVALYSQKWIENGSKVSNVVDEKPLELLPITLNSRVYGLGFQNLSFHHSLSNNAESKIAVLFRQVVPWFLRIYIHTIQFQCDRSNSSSFELLHYQPAIDRQLPHVLHIGLNIPERGTCQLTYNFDKSLLRWTEYPPDANYGFQLPAASVHFYPPNEIIDSSLISAALNLTYDGRTTTKPIEIYGDQLLVYLPTPDFSMPYNALCLVCTVLAMAFGPVHNLITRSFVFPTVSDRRGKLSIVRGWLSRLKQFRVHGMNE